MHSSSQRPSGPTVDFAITGMSCGHCVASVTDALAHVPGVTVERVTVGAARVTLDPAVDPATVVDAIRESGYEASLAVRPLPQAGGRSSCCSSSKPA